MSDNKTPFQRAGYTPEDWFEVIGCRSGGFEFTLGDKVSLFFDDGTYCPHFINEKGTKLYIHLEHIKPLKHPVKHICAFGDVFTTIPDGVFLEVSYTKNATTVYLDELQFICKTEERFKEVMQAIQTLFGQGE